MLRRSFGSVSSYAVLVAALGATVLLGGCQSLAVSMAGAGATAAIGATLAGISYRTFTAGQARLARGGQDERGCPGREGVSSAN